MQNNKIKYETEIIETIKKHNIMRFNHIFVMYTKISRSTAYVYKLDKSDSIKEALSQNRQKACISSVNKWLASDNPTLQIASYRLICDSDDHRRLNQKYIEQTGNATQLVIADKKMVKEVISKLWD